MPQVAAAGTVAAYYSIGTEPDTHGLVFALWKRGSYVVLPVLLPDGDLDWASYEGPGLARSRAQGLLQPVEPARGPGTVARADMVLVPALAVDAEREPARPGRRLLRPGARPGRRPGADDRAALRRRTAAHVPAEPHDRPVRAVVRPSHGLTWLPYGGSGISGSAARLSLAVAYREC